MVKYSIYKITIVTRIARIINACGGVKPKAIYTIL